MRGKRSKQYRKLMHQYDLSFGFREPYQVLVDAEIVTDSARFKMDLPKALERTVQGKVKPMITQCSMRHLYATKDNEVINFAKQFERRRCGHHELEEPLSTLACLSESVDAKNNNTNKHRYVVASQDGGVRAHMRRIPGVPLIYIHRSVMIMEPMGEATEEVRNKDERSKFRNGLKTRISNTLTGKRSREHDQPEPTRDDIEPAPKRQQKNTKSPNPLSMLKPKKRQSTNTADVDAMAVDEPSGTAPSGTEVEKAKRKRKPSKKPDAGIPTPAEILTGRSTILH